MIPKQEVIGCQFCDQVATYFYKDWITDPWTGEDYYSLVPVCKPHLVLLDSKR